MRTTQINESTNPESFNIEDPNTDGAYDQPSVVADKFISSLPQIGGSNALKVLVKKAYDGIYLFALYPTRFCYFWRRDMDVNPIKVGEFRVNARVESNSTWYDQLFSFDYANDSEVELTTVSAGVRYFLIMTKTAFGDADNYFAIDFKFTKGDVDNQFLVFSPGRKVKCQLQIDLRNAALAENRADSRGMTTPGDVQDVTPTVTVDTPSVGWTRYFYEWERATVCEDSNSRTPQQLFTQDAGLSVR